MVDSFIVYKSWFNGIAHLPKDKQDKCLADIMRYGVGEEPQNIGDDDVRLCLNLIKGQIDAAKDKYEQRKIAGENLGRKKSFSDQTVYELARQGKSSAEIAAELGCSKSTIDHSEGWRARKQEFAIFT